MSFITRVTRIFLTTTLVVIGRLRNAGFKTLYFRSLRIRGLAHTLLALVAVSFTRSRNASTTAGDLFKHLLIYRHEKQ